MVAECEDVRGHRSGGRTFHGVTGSNAPLGSPARHNTVHHINTTPGPPISSQPRRLAPDRLKIVKDEYDAMLQDGTATSSDSPWSSALHLTQRKIAVGASVLELVYGEPLRIPGKLLAAAPTHRDPPDLITRFHRHFDQLLLVPAARHASPLFSCTRFGGLLPHFPPAGRSTAPPGTYPQQPARRKRYESQSTADLSRCKPTG
jgi:hypothetical protein